MFTDLPFWAKKLSNGSYTEPNTILYTRDGRKIGNAKVEGRNGEFIRIRTDFGNVLLLTLPELKQLFYRPIYISE